MPCHARSVEGGTLLQHGRYGAVPVGSTHRVLGSTHRVLGSTHRVLCYSTEGMVQYLWVVLTGYSVVLTGYSATARKVWCSTCGWLIALLIEARSTDRVGLCSRKCYGRVLSPSALARLLWYRCHDEYGSDRCGGAGRQPPSETAHSRLAAPSDSAGLES
jgi:hypothetical protein